VFAAAYAIVSFDMISYAQCLSRPTLGFALGHWQAIVPASFLLCPFRWGGGHVTRAGDMGGAPVGLVPEFPDLDSDRREKTKENR